ncbi:hypothetical protein NE237_012488 [Protea cynaroides]|uniref:Bidirectional sugar transporter SWEET n=1 Tax=Protea cynaroides TaxID=273540 RepID=A0A9Q0H084_9MAGN|nr:hypothetical protein NE237_012488 [Protea cynaroides]
MHTGSNERVETREVISVGFHSECIVPTSHSFLKVTHPDSGTGKYKSVHPVPFVHHVIHSVAPLHDPKLPRKLVSLALFVPSKQALRAQQENKLKHNFTHVTNANFSTNMEERISWGVLISLIFCYSFELHVMGDICITNVLVLTLVHTGATRSLVVGSVCIFFGTLMYAAPLSVMNTCHSFSSLTTFANGICWTIYAFIYFDIFIMIPNSLRVVFGLAQLILYAMILYAMFYKSTQRRIEARKVKGEMRLADHVVVVVIQDSQIQ